MCSQSWELLAYTSEKAMAPHSSTLAWKIPWRKQPGRLQSMGSLRVGYDWATSLSLFTFMHWRRKWQPTPVLLPGESQGGGNLVGCRLWGRTVRHNWSDLAAAAAYTLSSWTKDLENINSFKLHQPPAYHIGIQWWIRTTVWETKSYKLGVLNLGCTQDELGRFKTGVIELWPASQIQPTTSFCMARKLRKVFTFLNALKKWEDYFKHLQIIWNANFSVHK